MLFNNARTIFNQQENDFIMMFYRQFESKDYSSSDNVLDISVGGSWFMVT